MANIKITNAGSNLVKECCKDIWFNLYERQYRDFSKILRTELQYGLASLFLGIYLSKTRILFYKYMCIPVLIVALSTVVKNVENSKCPRRMSGKQNVS